MNWGTRCSSVYWVEPLEARTLLSQYGLIDSFGDHGVAAAEFAGGEHFQQLLIVEQSDQTTLIAGPMSFNNSSTGHVVMARVNARGNIVAQWASSLDLRGVNAMALQPDGKIVIAALTLDAMQIVARFTTAGALDTSFAGDGVLELNFFQEPEYFDSTGVAVDPQGRILLLGRVGHTVGGYQDQRLLARLTSSGAFDSTFGTAGMVRMANGFPQDVGFQPDGKIILADNVDVRRFTDAGAVDKSFGSNGVASFSQLATYGRSVLVLPDGRILLNALDKLVRLSVDGALDTSFGDHGIATILQGLPPQTPKSFIAGDGSITVLDVYGVAKLSADGQPDPSFGISGRLNNYTDQNRSTLTGIVPYGGWNFALASNGDVLMSGYCNEPGARLARFEAQPDIFLGANGQLSITGTNDGDTIIVDSTGDQARVSRNGVVKTFALADVSSVDVLCGDGDNSIMVWLAVPTTVTTGAGNDTIVTGNRADNIDAGDGDDSIQTNGGNDSIAAGDGNNTVRGGAGDDVLIGGAGIDILDGGDGNDHFGNSPSQSSGIDTIDAGDGNDSLLDRGSAPMLVYCGAGNDVIDLGSGNDTIYGDDGNDVITTGDGNNLVFAGAGNDTIRAGAGQDTLWGEIGYDWMRGGGGDDLMNGGAGKDRMWGQDGEDRLYGRNNNDAIDGGPGNDRLLGGQGIDKFFGSEGDDLIYARNNDPETIDGGAGMDSCSWDDLLDVLMSVERY